MQPCKHAVRTNPRCNPRCKTSVHTENLNISSFISARAADFIRKTPSQTPRLPLGVHRKLSASILPWQHHWY